MLFFLVWVKVDAAKKVAEEAKEATQAKEEETKAAFEAQEMASAAVDKEQADVTGAEGHTTALLPTLIQTHTVPLSYSHTQKRQGEAVRS